MTPAKIESLDQAISHYQQLKEWVRAHDAEDLELYETSEKEGWHHSTVTKDSYLRLFYRTIWTSGFKSRVVRGKEEEYFRVVKELLYPQGRFQPKRQGEFLMKVASVLGGTGDNRKNKAVFHVIDLVESMGWDKFRNHYVVPQSGLAARLQELPMVGAKTVKLLLTLTGIAELAKDDDWVARFASQHGYADPDKCVCEVASRTGDAAKLIDFVIWDAGHKEGLDVRA